MIRTVSAACFLTLFIALQIWASDINSELIDAAQKGHTDIVQELLGKGTDANTKNTKGLTALMLAAQNGHTETVSLLIENKANVNAKDLLGFTALSYAKSPAVKKLLRQAGAIRYADSANNTSMVSPIDKPSYIVGIVADCNRTLDSNDFLGQFLTHYRFFSFKTSFDFGEEPPSTIKVSKSEKSSSSRELSKRTYLARKIDTVEHDSSVQWWHVFLTGIYLILTIFSVYFVGMNGFVIFLGDDREDRISSVKQVLIFSIIFTFIAFFAGYFYGATFIIDNGSDKTLEVSINGKSFATLPPYTYKEGKVVGGSLKVEVFTNKQVLESASLNLDKSFRQSIKRILLAPIGEIFVYNIGAINSYAKRAAYYR